MVKSIALARWRQCVLPWRHIRSTWRIRLNLCILRPTRVHNPNGKWISSAVFTQLTAESAYTLQSATLSTRIGPSHGESWPHDALGPCENKTQTAVLYRFSPFCTDDRRVSLYFTKFRPFPPQNCPSPWRDLDPCNTWFLWPTRVLNPNGNSIASTVLQGSLVWLTDDRQTERRQTETTDGRAIAYSERTKRIFACSNLYKLHNPFYINVAAPYNYFADMLKIKLKLNKR